MIDPRTVVLFNFFSSLEGGKAPDEDVVGVVPVEHADPNIPRVRPKLTPAPGQDLVLPKKARAVLHVLPVAPQPRERCDTAMDEHSSSDPWRTMLRSSEIWCAHTYQG